MSPKVFLVTGASKGFGFALVRQILKNGDIAVATLRNPDALNDLKTIYTPDQLLVLKLDVTSPEEVTSAFKTTKEVFGRLDVVINNAAMTAIGEVEGTEEQLLRTIFNTNFFGATDVSKKAIKFFREDNPTPGGRLLNISSISGKIGFPAIGAYCASKHALEGMTESLAGEMDPAWNIHVSLICPGSFRTSDITTSIRPPPSVYASPQLGGNQIRGYLRDADNIQGDPVKGANFILDVAKEEKPRLRYFVGPDALAGIRGVIETLKEQADSGAEKSVTTNFD